MTTCRCLSRSCKSICLRATSTSRLFVPGCAWVCGDWRVSVSCANMLIISDKRKPPKHARNGRCALGGGATGLRVLGMSGDSYWSIACSRDRRFTSQTACSFKSDRTCPRMLMRVRACVCACVRAFACKHVVPDFCLSVNKAETRSEMYSTVALCTSELLGFSIKARLAQVVRNIQPRTVFHLVFVRRRKARAQVRARISANQ